VLLANAEAIYVGTSAYPCVPIEHHPGVQRPYEERTKVYLTEISRLEKAYDVLHGMKEAPAPTSEADKYARGRQGRKQDRPAFQAG
jgi:hypothetical protein